MSQQEANLFAKPLSIRKVSIVGNNRTNHSVIEQELQAAYQGSTVAEVSEGLAKGLQALNRLDVFDSVSIECDAVEDSHAETDVVITVVEKGLMQVKAETFVETSGESGVETSASLRNALGSGEMIDVSTGYGYGNSTSFGVNLRKPRFFGLPMLFNSGVSRDVHNRLQVSGHTEKVMGAHATLSSYDGRHQFTLGSSWRDIVPMRVGEGDSKKAESTTSKPQDRFSYSSSAEILEQAHPSVKNSLAYTFTRDRRDHPLIPSSGSFFQFKTELAGLYGDVSFLKSQLTSQFYTPLFADDDDAVDRLYFDEEEEFEPSPEEAGPILGVSLKLGYLHPFFQPVQDVSCISDRFFLGGAMQLRGFNNMGVGPKGKTDTKKTGDALGGDVMWALGTNVTVPLVPRFGLRGQVFANAGNLVTQEHLSVRSLVRGLRASVGVGLVLPTPVGRLEMSYSRILRSSEMDQVKRFQLGVGADFL